MTKKVCTILVSIVTHADTFSCWSYTVLFNWVNVMSTKFAIKLQHYSSFTNAVVGIEKFVDCQPLTLQLQTQVRIYHINNYFT